MDSSDGVQLQSGYALLPLSPVNPNGTRFENPRIKPIRFHLNFPGFLS